MHFCFENTAIKICCFLSVFLCTSYSFAQFGEFPLEKPPKKDLAKKAILPGSLVLVGLLLTDTDFEKDVQADVRNALDNNFNTSLDDYTRYVPIAQLYIADIAGVQAKNHWFDQTKNLVISAGLTQLITTGLKKAVYKERPNQFNADAFPSGHTSNAFANATVLYEEFKETNSFLAYSGYGFATATGALRVMNNKHWISDVFVGAALGIMVTKLVYHFDYLFPWNPFKKKNDFVVLPSYADRALGIHLQKRF